MIYSLLSVGTRADHGDLLAGGWLIYSRKTSPFLPRFGGEKAQNFPVWTMPHCCLRSAITCQIELENFELHRFLSSNGKVRSLSPSPPFPSKACKCRKIRRVSKRSPFFPRFLQQALSANRKMRSNWTCKPIKTVCQTVAEQFLAESEPPASFFSGAPAGLRNSHSWFSPKYIDITGAAIFSAFLRRMKIIDIFSSKP